MSRADYDRWVAAGKPFTLMRPARDLRDRLRAHGYTVYDIGNEAHLLAQPPQDHTPYSDTGWPGTAKFGYGHAIDVMPPAAGAKSRIDGLPLPSLQQLGAQLLRDRQAGVKGISWLKYMNWEPQGNYTGPCYHDAWQPSYARTASSDRGHIHLSGATGLETSTIGAGYDPLAAIRGDDMPSAEEVARATVKLLLDTERFSPLPEHAGKVRYKLGATWAHGRLDTRREVVAAETRLSAQLAAVLAAVTGDQDAEQILARVDEHAAAQLAAVTGLRGELAQELAPALVTALRDELADIPAEDLETAMERATRRVLGSLDGAAPAAS